MSDIIYISTPQDENVSITVTEGNSSLTSYLNKISDIISQVEAEAGASTVARSWTAERVKQAILALSPAGSGDGYPFTFDSGDLVANVLSITHGLGKKYISRVVVYDNNDILVNDDNYDYKAIDTESGTITFYLPITGTWNGEAQS
jgi:hypothetical protein